MQLARTITKTGAIVSTISFEKISSRFKPETCVITKDGCYDVVEQYETSSEALIGHLKHVSNLGGFSLWNFLT